MPSILFRFYAELNEHLPSEHRQVDFTHTIDEGTTVAGAIAAIGVPIENIELILVNGEAVQLNHVLNGGERISVYPVFDAMDVGAVTKMESRPARRSRFVLDVHLGKLAHHLRMLGFDALYRNDTAPAELLKAARDDDRILLSKSASLVQHPDVVAGYRVRSSDPREQLIEILRRFDLTRLVQPFTRCLHCNAQVQSVPKGDVVDRLPQKSREMYDFFTSCPSCGRIYWEGSHVDKMKKFTEDVLAEVNRDH